VFGYVLVNGTFTNVAFPGALDTTVRGINPRGDLVGFYDTDDGSGHGIVGPLSHLASFDFPGGFNTGGFAINAAGDVVGSYDDGDGNGHGFLWTRRGRP